MLSPTPARRLARPTHRSTNIPIRILGATLGAYALCWALISFLCAWLALPKVSLWFLTGQLAPLPFLLALLWSFAVKKAWLALAAPLLLAAVLQGLAVLR